MNLKEYEDTREDFERVVIQVAKDYDYEFMNSLLKRIPDPSMSSGEKYGTSWVDMMWVGWCKRIELLEEEDI